MAFRHTRFALAGAATLAAAALALPATAETSTVTATVASSVSISTDPTANVDFGTLAVGVNTVSLGTIGISSNVAYTVTVQADRAAMTSWDGSAYGAEALGTPLALTPTLAGGVPVVTAIAAVSTSAQTLMTGTGLTSDSATLSLVQTLLGGDAPGTYRTVLTYTASQTL